MEVAAIGVKKSLRKPERDLLEEKDYCVFRPELRVGQRVRAAEEQGYEDEQP